MWSLCVAVDKLFKMAGDEEEEEEQAGPRRVSAAVLYKDSISHFVNVPHVRQRCNWDCGLACVLMVLRILGVDRCYDIRDLEELCGTRSIWTVDLAYLLHKFSVKFSFFTVTLGANPDFSGETFYREQLQDDLCRVDRLFARALETGISIQCRTISGREISVLVLSGQYVAIALVNKIKLSRSSLDDICISGCYNESSDYVGHYVVICGYDVVTEEFEIRDPANIRKHVRVSLECLDEARKSFGTDEDILVMDLHLAVDNSVVYLFGRISLNGKDGKTQS